MILFLSESNPHEKDTQNIVNLNVFNLCVKVVLTNIHVCVTTYVEANYLHLLVNNTSNGFVNLVLTLVSISMYVLYRKQIE